MRVPRKQLAELVQFVAKREGVRLGQVDISIVSSREVAQLNRRFLRHAGATDVISFDLSDMDVPGLSVQLVICAEVAIQQARARNLKPQHELMLYVVHGLLHQMGYEDESIRGGVKMQARQEELLKEFLATSRKRKAATKPSK